MYHPLVQFADGRRAEAEEAIPRWEIPPRGQEMTLTCDTATLTRCRLPTFWGVHYHLVGLTMLLLVVSAGPLWEVRTIVQDVAVAPNSQGCLSRTLTADELG